jgi:hypothetical protein
MEERSRLMSHQSLSESNGKKLIRFFRIVAMFGAVVAVARVLIFIAVVSGILYILL